MGKYCNYQLDTMKLGRKRGKKYIYKKRKQTIVTICRITKNKWLYLLINWRASLFKSKQFYSNFYELE
jgi:hypothetical protein